jgi:hypothetical protein
MFWYSLKSFLEREKQCPQERSSDLNPIERLGVMKHFVRDSFDDDPPDEEDEIFSRLEQLKPPADFVNRVMQAISRLPLPQMLQPGGELAWDDDDNPMVHHEHKRPS